MTDLPLLAVLYRPGAAWDPKLPFHQQVGVADHRDFLAAQYAAGRLYFGGPFLDDSGGLSVFRRVSRQQLDEILRNDRSVERGLLSYEVRPYALGFAPKPSSDTE